MSKIANFRHCWHDARYGGGAMNMNVSLTEELANFVKAKVSAGRYHLVDGEMGSLSAVGSSCASDRQKIRARSAYRRIKAQTLPAGNGVADTAVTRRAGRRWTSAGLHELGRWCGVKTARLRRARRKNSNSDQPAVHGWRPQLKLNRLESRDSAPPARNPRPSSDRTAKDRSSERPAPASPSPRRPPRRRFYRILP